MLLSLGHLLIVSFSHTVFERVSCTKEGGQRLGGFEEFCSCDCVVLLLVNGNIGEGSFERVEEGCSWWVGISACHDCEFRG